MIKKLAAILLSAALLLTGVTLSASADQGTYTDIEGNWAKAAIQRWTSYGIISGYNGKFNPNNPMTRAEFARVLTGVLGLTDGNIPNTFTDLPANSWYTPYILRAVKAGILSGDGKGHALPNKPITREQAFSMLVRAVHLVPQKTPDQVLSQYADGDIVGGWAKTVVSSMVEAGYVSGTGKNMLTPKHNITRAAVIHLLDVLFPTLVRDNEKSYALAESGYTAVSTPETVTLFGTGPSVLIAPGAKGGEVRLSGASVEKELIIDAPGVTVVLDGSKVPGEVRILAENVTLQIEDGSLVQEVGVHADNATIAGDGVVGQVTPYSGADLQVTANVAKINSAPLGVSPLQLKDASGETEGALIQNSAIEVSSEMGRDGVTVVTVTVHGENLLYHQRLVSGKLTGGFWSGIALTAPRSADGCIAGAGTTKESALKSFRSKTVADALTEGVDATGKKAGREIALDIGQDAYKDAVTPGGTGIWACIQWYSGKVALNAVTLYHIYFDVTTSK